MASYGVPAALLLKIQLFCYMTSLDWWTVTDMLPHRRSFKKSWPVNTKKTRFSEAPVIIYFTWHHIPEDFTLNRAELPIWPYNKKRYSPADCLVVDLVVSSADVTVLRYDGKYSSNSCCHPSVLFAQFIRVDTVVILRQQTDTITRNWVHNKRAKRRPNDTTQLNAVELTEDSQLRATHPLSGDR
jgi:hypothetical protein